MHTHSERNPSDVIDTYYGFHTVKVQRGVRAILQVRNASSVTHIDYGFNLVEV